MEQPSEYKPSDSDIMTHELRSPTMTPIFDQGPELGFSGNQPKYEHREVS